jgi:hypothetical protein
MKPSPFTQTHRSGIGRALLAVATAAGSLSAPAFADIIDVAGAYTNNPVATIGAENTANMTGDTLFEFWGEFASPIPVITNGFLFTVDSGSGNPVTLTGPITGEGGVRLIGAAYWAGPWDVPIELSGSTPNTYEGLTTVARGTVRLAKNGAIAIPGDLMVGSAIDSGRIAWAGHDQIADTANITLVPIELPPEHAGRETALILNGYMERINELHLGTGSYVRTGPGGILNVNRLIVDGEEIPRGAYTASSGFVTGTGYIDVGDFGPPIITEPPGLPADPTPADFANNIHPAMQTKLSWAPSSNAGEYEVYFWTADRDKPEWPTAVVQESEYAFGYDLDSRTTYNWQVVAINALDSTEGPIWTFETVDRKLVYGEIVNPNHWIGFEGTATLIDDTIFGWQTNQTAIPVNLGGYKLTMDSGGGNNFVYGGNLSGDGQLVFRHAGYHSALWANEMRIVGDIGNDYHGTAWLEFGTLRMEKSNGDALRGPITVGSANNSARLVWGADNQIHDDSDLYVVYFDADAAGYPERATYLNLNGNSDTVGSVEMHEGTFIHTGDGGVLTINNRLVVGLTTLAADTYTSVNAPDFVKGSGRVVVLSGGSGGEVFDGWAASKGLTGAMAAFDADPDGDGVPNGIEFAIGGEPNPENPNSNSAHLLPVTRVEENYFVITFTRRNDAAALNPTIEFSTRLDGSWVAANTSNSIIEITPGVDSATVSVKIPRGSSPTLFARLKATRA